MPSRRAPAAAGRAVVLTTDDLRLGGCHPALGAREVRAGRWQRAAHGVYLPHARPPTARDLVAAARAHVGQQMLVTGVVVLRELGLPWLPSTEGIHVLVPAEASRSSSGLVRVSRSARFGELPTWTRYGASFVDAARALVDASRALTDLRDVRGVILGGAASRWASPAELRQQLDAGRRNGSALTRRAVVDAERGCASPPEAELVDALIGSAVPFYANPELWLNGELLGIPDVWLPGLGIGGEVESRERHETTDEQVQSTFDRHERLTAPGLELVHLSVGRIRRDAHAAAGHLLARAAVRRRLAPHLREPAGLALVPRGPLLR